MTTGSKESPNEALEKTETRKLRHVCVTGEPTLAVRVFYFLFILFYFCNMKLFLTNFIFNK